MLFDWVGSVGVAEVIDAVLVRFRSGVLPFTVPTMVIVTVAPELTAPRAQVTRWPAVVQVPPPPPVAVPTGDVTTAGMSSTTCTPVAPDGPLFRAVRVKVTWLPATSGFGEVVLVSDRSADGLVLETKLAELLDVSGSLLDVTVAVLVRVPPGMVSGVVTTISRVTVSPAGIEPIVQVTVRPAFVQPPVALVKPTPTGRVSVSVTPAAWDGPALRTPSV